MDWLNKVNTAIKAQYTQDRFVELYGERLGFKTKGALGHQLSGRRKMSVQTLIEIADILKLPIGSFFGEEESAGEQVLLSDIKESLLLVMGTLKDIGTFDKMSAEDLVNYVLADLIKEEGEPMMVSIERAKSL